jgi:hypothetical protein
MHRHVIAASAVVFLSIAAATWWWHPESQGLLAFSWRTGAILAIAWLAYDDIQRLPNWLLIATPLLLVLLAWRPRILLLLLPALIVLVVLRRLLWPRGK